LNFLSFPIAYQKIFDSTNFIYIISGYDYSYSEKARLVYRRDESPSLNNSAVHLWYPSSGAAMVNHTSRMLWGQRRQEPSDAVSLYSHRANEKGEKKLHRVQGVLSCIGAATDTAQNLRDRRQERSDQVGTSNPSGLRGCQNMIASKGMPVVIAVLLAVAIGAISASGIEGAIHSAYALNPQPLPPGLKSPYILLNIANAKLSSSENILLAVQQEPPDPCLSSTASQGCVAVLTAASNHLLDAQAIVNGVGANYCQLPPDPCTTDPSVIAQLRQVVSTSDQIVTTANQLKSQIPPGPANNVLDSIIGDAQSTANAASALLSPPVTSGPP